MGDGPVVIAGDSLFRIVRLSENGGERVTYVVEASDGCDALGVERWREFKVSDNKHIRAMRDYIIRTAVNRGE